MSEEAGNLAGNLTETVKNIIDTSPDGTGSTQEKESLSDLSSEEQLLADVEAELAKLNNTEEDELEEKEEKPEDVEEKKSEVKKEDEKLAARFAALSRREKEIGAREKQTKADMETVNTFRKGILEGKENPKGVIELLKNHGITFEDLARAEMGDLNLEKDLNTRKLEARLEAVEKQRLADLKEAQDKHGQAQIEGFKSEIATFIKASADKYETVAHFGLVDDVFRLIEKDAKANVGNKNYVLKSIESAVSELEDSLTEHTNKILKLKKFSKSVEKLEDIEPEARDIKASKTISNKMPASSKVAVKKQIETDADREKAATKLLEEYWK